ncbi:MAG: hypothetical protein GF331_06065 [Chitinivibrionales bacterium]|nr:hypothetical protein [Chitinivibrionales bacterium]
MHTKITARVLMSLLLAGLFVPSLPAQAGVDLSVLSLGTWITTNDNTGGDSKDSYFNTVKLSLYYHVWKIKGYVGLPVTLTLEDYEDKTKYAFYPADAALYVGTSLGRVEPRIGLSFPMGYPTDDTIAWIGSGNVKLLAGLGFNLGSCCNDRLSFGGEYLGRIYLSDTTSGARIGRWSTGMYLSVKGAYRFSDRIKAGLELFPTFSWFTYTDWGEHGYGSAGLLPLLFASLQPNPRIEISVKAGYGFSISGTEWERTQAVISGSVGLVTYW